MLASDVLNADRSWLYHLSQALNVAGVECIYQAKQERFASGKEFDLGVDFAIASPANQWSFDEETRQVALTFRVGVVTSQEPGQVLAAHTRIFGLQTVIEQALFGSDRLIVGAGGKTYSVPLRVFDADGQPTGILPRGIDYQRAEWIDQSPEWENTRFWGMEISASVEI